MFEKVEKFKKRKKVRVIIEVILVISSLVALIVCLKKSLIGIRMGDFVADLLGLFDSEQKYSFDERYIIPFMILIFVFPISVCVLIKDKFFIGYYNISSYEDEVYIYVGLLYTKLYINGKCADTVCCLLTDYLAGKLNDCSVITCCPIGFHGFHVSYTNSTEDFNVSISDLII